MSVHIKKNDNVMVIAGKDKGKTGRIIKVLPGEHRAVIERINLIKRHLRPRSAQQPGGIVEKEAPIHLSNIMVMCDPCNAPVRVGSKRLADGKKVRVCRRCGENLE